MNRLDRDKAQEVIANAIAFEDTYEAILDRLEACVVEDQRIVRIEALVSPPDRLYNFPVPAEDLRAILRGDQ